MATIPPIIRHMILCDDVSQQGSTAIIKHTLQGVTHSIRAKPGESFPITHPELCVYVTFTGGSGTGRIEVVIVDADTEEQVFGSPEHDYQHPADRHALMGIAFRLQRCVFPRPGLYWVEFRHDGVTLARVPLVVRL